MPSSRESVSGRRATCYTDSFCVLWLHDPGVKNFLKTAAHQHKDPQVRLGYINDLDDNIEQEQPQLCRMARDDQDLSVRLAAVAKIDDLSVLRELLGASTDDAEQIRSAAEQRLTDKVVAEQVSDVALRALLSTHAAQLAVPVAALCPIAEQREVALQAVSDESALVGVIQQSRFHDTRLAAAQRLTQHDSIKAAISAIRSKDKVVAKCLQQQLDAQADAEAALIARGHAVSSTLQAAVALSEGVWSPQHGGKLQALREKWASLETADRHEHEASFTAAIAKAEAGLQAYTHEQEALQKTATASTESAAQTLSDNSDEPEAAISGDDNGCDGADGLSNATLQASSETTTSSAEQDAVAPSPPAKDLALDDPALAAALVKVSTDDIEALVKRNTSAPDAPLIDVADASESVEQLRAYLQALVVLFDPPYDINKARPAALQQRINRVKTLLDINSVMPGIYVAEHTYYKALSTHSDVLVDRLGKAQQESADRIKATHRQFSALGAVIKDGKWGPANSMMRRLRKKIDLMEPAERSSLNEKLTRAESQLAEMADWQDFAARPKLDALCEAMEALPAQNLDPDALAKQVRKLQSEWKGLGVSRASNDLWSRFKGAGDAAYEPCKEWFEEKQKARQQKIDAKTALCDALESDNELLSGDVDWRAVVKRVNQVKREWSNNRVPDRKPDKALESRFSVALEPFESALTEQYDSNAAEKQQLVEKAQALAEGEINQHSANQAKKLLAAWKLVGVMRRREDQALWEVFNGHLGTIFKHQHKVEREKQRAGLEHVFRAKDIIKRLKTLSRGDTLNEDDVQSLTTEFRELAEFPERDKKFLLRDFRQAVDSCSRVQEVASKRRAQAGQEETHRLLLLCEQLEGAVEQPDSALDTLVDDVTHAWDSSDVKVSPELDTILKARRDQALAHIKAGDQPDYATNEQLRRDLLIRMEVAAGIETPAEDKSRRMKYQLEHLQQGMTSAGLNDKKQLLNQLEKQWMAVGPVKASTRDTLNSRYLKACKR